jgi:hypothetical protein
MTPKAKRAGSEFWQIFFPAGLMGLAFIAIGVLVILKLGSDNTARLAEISSVILIIPVLVFSLIWFIVLGGLIFLVSRLAGVLPSFTRKILDLLEKLNSLVKQISTQLTKPVIYPTALLGGLNRLRDQKRHRSIKE